MRAHTLAWLVLAGTLVGCPKPDPDTGEEDTDVVDDDLPSDADRDGYVAAADGGEDCDDADAAIHPDAEERCDGVDNNCDGAVDEAPVNGRDFFRDADADGFGDSEQVVNACAAPGGYAGRGGDCDDGDAAFSPGVPDLCDGIDNDCDGWVDEGCAGALDVDGDGYLAVADGGSDCDDTDGDIFPGAEEVCDGVDNDCDGGVDLDAVDGEPYFRDADGDGYGDGADRLIRCALPAGYVARAGDCDDGDRAISPDALERCDGEDNDCDGTVDVDPTDGDTWYLDLDGDHYGDAALTAIACALPAGYAAEDGDCAVDDAEVFPGAAERCDGVDNDCDGEVDLDPVDGVTFFADGDGDGFGDGAQAVVRCAQPEGYVGDEGDCADDDPAIHPAAAELCDEVDNDCDGEVDVDPVNGDTYFADADGDSYGDALVFVVRCALPEGYSADQTDCDDGDASVFPAAEEACDGIDNNCDTQVDEECPPPVEDCADGVDNDEDGIADCEDPDCAQDPACVELDCADALDGDGDGLTDCDDDDCAADAACLESECSDGVDNDGDGLADCEDADCVLDVTCYEADCADALDGDGDGLTDCDDDDCWGEGDCVFNGQLRAQVQGGTLTNLQDYRVWRGSSGAGWTRVMEGTAREIEGVVELLPGPLSWETAEAPVACAFGYATASFSERSASTDGAMDHGLGAVLRSGFWIEGDCPVQSSAFLPTHLVMAAGWAPAGGPGWDVASSYHTSSSAPFYDRGPGWLTGAGALVGATFSSTSSGFQAYKSWEIGALEPTEAWFYGP